MILNILPISGGGFVTQLSIIQHLCENKLIPDLIIASSGGNVAAYVACAANWKWPAIERVAADLSQSMFLCSWASTSVLSYIIGHYKGGIYNQGSGVIKFLTNHFTEESIMKHEIWTGTFNIDKKKTHIFCNKKRKESILDISDIDLELTQTMEPSYLNGDLDAIAKIAIASASIPTLVPPQLINGDNYIDGGIASASPLITMRQPIIRHVKDNGLPLHIIYINSLNLCEVKNTICNNMFDNIKQTTADLVRNQTVNDRLSAYDILSSFPGPISYIQFPCNYQNISQVKKLHENITYSMMEIYPSSSEEIDITSFNGQDVVEKIRYLYDKCHCNLWWVADHYSYEDIKNYF